MNFNTENEITNFMEESYLEIYFEDCKASIEKFRIMLEKENKSQFIEEQYAFLLRISQIIEEAYNSKDLERFLEISAEFLEALKLESKIERRSSVPNELRKLILNNVVKKSYSISNIKEQRLVILRNITLLCSEKICML